MEKQKTSARYSPEVRVRAVRMVQKYAGGHGLQWAAIGSITAKRIIADNTQRYKAWLSLVDKGGVVQLITDALI